MITKMSVLGQVIDPMFDKAMAERLVNLRADAAVQERVDVLADKCTEGTLTPAEQSEYDAYVDAFEVVTLMQAKARSVLSGRQE